MAFPEAYKKHPVSCTQRAYILAAQGFQARRYETSGRYVAETSALPARIQAHNLQIWGPKILHGALASITDIWLCRLTRKIAGERYVPVAVSLHLACIHKP